MAPAKFVFVIIVFAWSFSGPAFAQDEGDRSKKLYWIFLTTGRSTDGVAPDEVKKMQNAHLANFASLSREGKLLTAGPMRDPERVLRGIVVVKAPDRHAVDRMFEPDPYVAGAYMNVEAHEANIDHGRIAAKVTTESLEEFRIVIFSDPQKADSKTTRIDGQSDYVRKHVGAVLLACQFVGQGSRRSVWIAKPQDDLEQTIAASPAVASGGLSYRIVPLFLQKGSLVGDKVSS